MANYPWLETLLATTVDHAVILMDDRGCILEWLGASERIFGYTAAEAVGQRSSLLFTAEDVQHGLDGHEIDVALATGRSEDDRWHRRKDHVNFWGSGVLARVTTDDQARPVLCKVVRDRTDIRSQITMLENLVAARDAEIERRSRFTATTFHELSNPLNPMVMAVELLGHTRPTGLAEQAMKILQSQTRVLSTLLRDLLQAIDVGSAKFLLSLERVNLGDALKESTDSLAPVAAKAGVQLRLLLPTGDLFIKADATRLSQMILNLVGNAIKYTPAGGHVFVTATIEGDMGVVRIEDDGVGMDESVLPHIFELFTREGRDPHVQGLGVGLAVVSQLAQLHGGMVEARSPGRGKGSVFSLRLPAWDAARTRGDARAGPRSTGESR